MGILYGGYDDYIDEEMECRKRRLREAMTDKMLVEIIVWGSFIATAIGGHYWGKHAADEWYAKHPVVETAIVDPCPGGTFHHDHVTVYSNGNKLYGGPAVPKGKP